MRMKTGGEEPTYARVLGTCPNAVVNPDTGKPVNKHAVYTVFRERCYDDDSDPDDRWECQQRLARNALTEECQARRLAWGHYIRDFDHHASWYYRHVVWTDLCNTILPTTEQRAKEMALARKAKKGWISTGSKEKSENLRGRKEVDDKEKK